MKQLPEQQREVIKELVRAGRQDLAEAYAKAHGFRIANKEVQAAQKDSWGVTRGALKESFMKKVTQGLDMLPGQMNPKAKQDANKNVVVFTLDAVNSSKKWTIRVWFMDKDAANSVIRYKVDGKESGKGAVPIMSLLLTPNSLIAHMWKDAIKQVKGLGDDVRAIFKDLA